MIPLRLLAASGRCVVCNDLADAHSISDDEPLCAACWELEREELERDARDAEYDDRYDPPPAAPGCGIKPDDRWP